jgi:hypothetical protein
MREGAAGAAAAAGQTPAAAPPPENRWRHPSSSSSSSSGSRRRACAHCWGAAHLPPRDTARGARMAGASTRPAPACSLRSPSAAHPALHCTAHTDLQVRALVVHLGGGQDRAAGRAAHAGHAVVPQHCGVIHRCGGPVVRGAGAPPPRARAARGEWGLCIFALACLPLCGRARATLLDLQPRSRQACACPAWHHALQRAGASKQHQGNHATPCHSPYCQVYPPGTARCVWRGTRCTTAGARCTPRASVRANG